jgi:arylsulfatase A-like enzyme
MFEDIEIPEPETFDDDYETRRIAAAAEDMRFDVSIARDYDDLPADLDAAGRKRWIYQRMMKDRFRTIYGVDENLGRVLDYLDENGLADDTLILYTSDHGYFLGDHGWYDKRFMYEPSLRIPLVACYPRIGITQHVADELVMNVDFAPTILDFAGLDIPDSVQGRSLRPLMEGKSPADWRQSVYYAYYENSWVLAGKGDDAMAEPYLYFTPHRIGPHRGVRTQRFKLIEYYAEGDYWELFDLERDPNELRNLYGQPGYESITAELRAELQQLREQYQDTE